MFRNQAFTNLIAHLAPIGLLVCAVAAIELIAPIPGKTRTLLGFAALLAAVLVLAQASAIGRMRHARGSHPR
jgi:hypothetical protein